MSHLNTFSSFVKNEFLDEYVEIYLDNLLSMDVPIMKFFSHLSREQMRETSRISCQKFLEGFESGTAIEQAMENLRHWEADTIPAGVPKKAIGPTDLVRIYAVQKRTLNRLIPKYTADLATGLAITSELEDYYSEVQEKAIQMLFKIQKETEKELERKNEQLEEAQALAHIGSWEWHSDSKTITWSEELYRIYGRDPHAKKITQEDFFTHLVPEETTSVVEEWRSFIKTGQPFRLEYTIIRESGERRILETHAHPIHENGKLIRVHGTTQDVTEIRQVEIEREISKQKDEFMSIASHELKTPLTSIKAYIDLMDQLLRKDPGSNASMVKYVHKAKDNLSKLHNLISDLLDVSKINAGKLQLNIVSLNFKDLLADCIDTISHISPTHRIEVHGNPDVMVEADRHRIEQVLVNYLTNAVKYSPKSDKVIVNVSTRDNHLQVAISDFGIGIPKDKLGKIFTRFYRVNDDLHAFSGLGIGLYIVSEIIKRHSGKVWVESDEGKGSTFYFSLPLPG